MQQINVIVTPKAKQTISVTVNGVAMSVVNSDGSYSTTHYSGTPFIIPNITVTDSDGSTYSYPSVKDVTCTPPVGADVENSDGSYTQHINNGATLVLPDTTIKNTAGATILTQPSCTNTGVIADCRVVNSDATYDENVPAGTTHNLADITHIDSDGTPTILTAMTPMVCTPPPPAVQTYASARVMKTGQTTSYRTGDDGDIEAGRETSFLVLKENNPFGNTNRFTDELGGNIYTNNWVIDWSTFDGLTVLGYYRVAQVAASWNNAIDNSLGAFGSFSGCRLWNINEAMNIMRHSSSHPFNYSPFNISTTSNLWTSTTRPSATNAAYYINNANGYWVVTADQDKGTSMQYVVVRTFTVTGTILT